jgi:hypothetical protein
MNVLWHCLQMHGSVVFETWFEAGRKLRQTRVVWIQQRAFSLVKPPSSRIQHVAISEVELVSLTAISMVSTPLIEIWYPCCIRA